MLYVQRRLYVGICLTNAKPPATSFLQMFNQNRYWAFFAVGLIVVLASALFGSLARRSQPSARGAEAQVRAGAERHGRSKAVAFKNAEERASTQVRSIPKSGSQKAPVVPKSSEPKSASAAQVQSTTATEERVMSEDEIEYRLAQASAEVHGGGGAEGAPVNPGPGIIYDDSYKVNESFGNAGKEFGVPADLLKAMAYLETHGEHRMGKPSIEGGFGVMNLRESSISHTLDEASKLLGLDKETLMIDPVQNIRGAAAVLRAYHDDAEALNTATNPWTVAISLYCGMTSEQAVDYIHQIEELMGKGLSHNTTFGEPMNIRPQQMSLLSAGTPEPKKGGAN